MLRRVYCVAPVIDFSRHERYFVCGRVEAVKIEFRATGFHMYPPFGFVANNRQPMFFPSASLSDPRRRN